MTHSEPHNSGASGLNRFIHPRRPSEQGRERDGLCSDDGGGGDVCVKEVAAAAAVDLIANSRRNDERASERASVGSEVSDFVRGNADVTVTFMTAGKKPTDIHEMHEKDCKKRLDSRQRDNGIIPYLVL